jgi:hypothetical protein
MKKYAGVVIVLAGLAMMFPAPIQLIRYGAGHPTARVLAQLWLSGLPTIIIGLVINRIVTPPPRK